MEEVYRRCASVFIPRIYQGTMEVLLVHKPRKNDDWQLPQGGCEPGESIANTALREVKEETNLEIQILHDTGIMYQYDFPASYRRFRPDNVRGQQVHFVIAEIISEVPLEVDGQEIDKAAWVPLDDLANYLPRQEYLDFVLKVADVYLATTVNVPQ